jgi:hypothetical protein
VKNVWLGSAFSLMPGMVKVPLTPSRKAARLGPAGAAAAGGPPAAAAGGAAAGGAAGTGAPGCR